MIGSVARTMDRIMVATPESPIAVFKTADGYGKPALLSVFAATIETHRMIAARELPLVGIFHRDLNADDVRKKLARTLQ